MWHINWRLAQKTFQLKRAAREEGEDENKIIPPTEIILEQGDTILCRSWGQED